MRIGATAMAAALASCTTTQLPRMSVTEANSQIHEGYVLTAGDRLKVTVFDEPNLTGEYQVGARGDLALPLIDAIEAEGSSPEDLAATIAAALAEGGYVLDPRVAVEVMQYRPIYVLGEVGRPGEYPYANELTFLQAVAKAGGFTARANKDSVVLQRAGAAERLVELGDAPLMVAPGDTVIVREAFF
jgi:polysaccharide export outer membrane protein